MKKFFSISFILALLCATSINSVFAQDGENYVFLFTGSGSSYNNDFGSLDSKRSWEVGMGFTTFGNRIAWTAKFSGAQFIDYYRPATNEHNTIQFRSLTFSSGLIAFNHNMSELLDGTAIMIEGGPIFVDGKTYPTVPSMVASSLQFNFNWPRWVSNDKWIENAKFGFFVRTTYHVLFLDLDSFGGDLKYNPGAAIKLGFHMLVKEG